MTMCSRCHKRIAVVFMTKIENGETKQDGICIKCARELGIKPVNDMINKMGLTDDDIDKMNAEIENLMEGGGDEMLEGLMGQLGGPPAPVSDDEEADSRAPAVDFSKLSGGSAADVRGKKKKKELKFLTTYCTNMTERARDGALDNVVGRDRELSRVIQILCRSVLRVSADVIVYGQHFLVVGLAFQVKPGKSFHYLAAYFGFLLRAVIIRKLVVDFHGGAGAVMRRLSLAFI